MQRSDVADSVNDPTAGRTGRRLLIASLTLGFVALIVAILAVAWVNARGREHSYWVAHTYEVEQAITSYRVLVEQVESARRGYLIDPDPRFVAPYRYATGRLPGALDRVDRLTRDNPVEVANVVQLRRLTGQLLQLETRTSTLATAGAAPAARAVFAGDASGVVLNRLRTVTRTMLAEQRHLLVGRDAQLAANVRTFRLVLLLSALVVVLLAIASLLTILRYTRDLRASGERLRELNESLEDTVAERTSDLTRANAEIQRFAYIVSHDLRSPLVNVMGFTAELGAATEVLRELVERADADCPGIVTEEARLAAVEDLPEAIGFIRSSTERMDRLINAILKLSREGRRVIAAERVDLDALLDGIRDTVQHRIDEEEIVLVVDHPLPSIVSDRVALEQIFSNLIENAIKYLQPGRKGRITVGGRQEGTRLVFEVADNGRGIDARDHERVFDLFRRSGTQDRPGEGIGLAHVRALAYRLGGTIDLASTLGVGSTFRLMLPAQYIPPRDETK